MKVVNLRKAKHTVYIGRPSIFGNPFAMGLYCNRQMAIDKYERYIRLELDKYLIGQGSAVIEAIKKLPQNAKLGCYCKPLACHGDIIVKIWKELHNN